MKLLQLFMLSKQEFLELLMYSLKEMFTFSEPLMDSILYAYLLNVVCSLSILKTILLILNLLL